MRHTVKKRWMHAAAIALMSLLLALPAWAAGDFFLYGNQGAANIIEQDIPEVDQSYFTAVDYFRSGPYQGRMLAATGTTVYLQSAAGSSTWIPVAQVDNVMDPAFVRISPSGDKIALGLGWMQDILVFNTTVLNTSTPADLNINPNPNVTVYPENHYDAAWVGEDFLVINGGQWVVEGQSAISGVVSLDVTDPYAMAQGLCGNIPGASSSIAVDANHNLVFGIGAGTNTGELKVWPADEWWIGNAPTSTALDYQASGLKFADSIMSAAYLGFDSQGNLHAGGGEFVNPGTVNLESGYAALISGKVIADAVASVTDPELDLYQVDESKPDQYREFSPDVCRNDTATGAIFTDRGLAVLWNPATAPGSTNCVIGGNNDWWAPNVAPKVTEYRIDITLDQDGDGFADVIDYSPKTNFNQNIDSNGDGYGNNIDADFDNNGIVNANDLLMLRSKLGTDDGDTDMNCDGIVNANDLLYYQKQYGKTAPYYGF